MSLQPRRMTGSVLRAAAKATGAPAVGKRVRRASLTMYGIGALHQARLGKVRPYLAAAPELSAPPRSREDPGKPDAEGTA